MIGLMMNMLKSIDHGIEIITKLVNYQNQTFGNGTMDYTVPANDSLLISDLAYRTTLTLEFRNLTVSQGARVRSNTYYDGTKNVGGAYAPLLIKCSNKLTVAGRIDADGCGGIPDSHGVWIEPTDLNINIPYTTTKGYSASYETYQTLRQYAAINMLPSIAPFLCGSGSASYGGWNAAINYGISNGGGTNTANERGGGGGGAEFLYYNKLTINGKEYGVDPGCEVWRVCANGVGGWTTGQKNADGYGGGTVIIAAKEIEITNTGQISANGSVNRTSGGSNFSFLNNIPQLASGQSGMYWDNNAQQYTFGSTDNRTYYYNDGTGDNVCNQNMHAGTSYLCGGAGVAIGIKVTK